MKNTTKFILTGVATLAVLGLGTAGAVGMSNALSFGDQTGHVQPIAPVVAGTASPTSTPSASGTPEATGTPEPEPSGATTVAPAAPKYIDDHGNDAADDNGTGASGADDNSTTGHDLNDDNGGQKSGGQNTDGQSGGSGDGAGHH